MVILKQKKKTIMICDDEQDVLLFFKLALKSKSNIILVSSGEDCINKYKEEKSRGNEIHLILLDYRLGSMHGDSVARKIKEHNGTKIILISAYDLDDVLLKELEDGGYIAKQIKILNGQYRNKKHTNNMNYRSQNKHDC
jgi:CheY-like chemotaxis protein